MQKRGYRVIGKNCIHLRRPVEVEFKNRKRYFCMVTCLKCGPYTTCNQFSDKGKLLFEAKEELNEKVK